MSFPNQKPIPPLFYYALVWFLTKRLGKFQIDDLFMLLSSHVEITVILEAELISPFSFFFFFFLFLCLIGGRSMRDMDRLWGKTEKSGVLLMDQGVSQAYVTNNCISVSYLGLEHPRL